jgi:hypothetical protein
LPEEEVKRWFVSTASGVAYLHQQDIVHRDLKPGNIFLDEETHVIKIGDYGLSKYMNTSRRSGQTESVGTFHYMAPEIGGGVYGREIDIYALGIILFEILTGDVPFDGESTQEIIMKHLTDDPKLDRVPAGFRKAIRIALQKDPEMRYHNVPEMLADLPWPDVAENCQKILAWNTVGSLVSSSRKPVPAFTDNGSINPLEITQTRLTVAQQASVSDSRGRAASSSVPEVEEIELVQADQVQVIGLGPGADIVFGPLKDLSQPGADSKHSDSSQSSIQKSSANTATSNVPRGNGAVEARSLSEGSENSHVITLYRSTAPSARVLAGEISRLPAAEILYPETRPYHGTGTFTRGVEEPIARSLQSGFDRLAHWWTYGNVSTPVKVVLLTAISLTLVLNSAWLLPLAAGLGGVYLIYYFLRTWWIGEPVTTALNFNQRDLKKRIADELRTRLESRSTSRRFAELLGSLAIAAFACSVLCLLGMALGGSAWKASRDLWLVYGWMAATSITASWSLLIVSKFWENRPAEAKMRRFTMVFTGLAVGAFAYFMANALSINLAEATQLSAIESPDSKVIIKGMPMLPACMLYWASLFGILRWWKMADPVRSTRLSILSVSFCLIWASLFSVLLELPVLPNCILAVVISVAVQLASPWWSIEEANGSFASKA